MSNPETVEITVEFTGSQAWALAQFLKRSHFNHYRECAASTDEAYLMIDAAHRLMHTLAEKGYAPR